MPALNSGGIRFKKYKCVVLWGVCFLYEIPAEGNFDLTLRLMINLTEASRRG